MNIPDYLSHHYTSTSSTNIFNFIISGAGGSGKTTGLLETYRRLCKESVKTSDDKLLVPIFIPASKLIRDDISPIQKYIIQNFLHVKPSQDLSTLYAALRNDIFDNEKSTMHFLIFLDALNENFNYLVMTEEIRHLSEMRNVNICVTVRSPKTLSSLENFKILLMQRLDSERIERVLGNLDGLNEKLQKLVTIPFYLAKYIELLEKNNDTENIFSITTAYDLLESYYRVVRKTQMQNVQYSSVSIKERFDAVTIRFLEAEESLDRVAPAIAFSIARKKAFAADNEFFSTSMMFTLSDKNVLHDIHDNYRRSSRYAETNLINNLPDTIKYYLEPMGIVVTEKEETDDHAACYVFAHEFVRDYLVVKFIVHAIVNQLFITTKDYQLYSMEIMDMLAGAMIHDTSFLHDDGNFNYEGFSVNGEEGMVCCMRKFHLFSPNELNIALSNFSWFVYNILQNIHNNEENRKPSFCKSFFNMSSKVMNMITVDDIKSRRIVLTNALLEFMRMHCEILRRAHETEMCAQASKYMRDICQIASTDEELCQSAGKDILIEQLGEAENMRYKNKIEVLYDSLKRKEAIDESELLDALKGLHNNQNTSSANLIAMLVYQPDPIMQHFINDFCNQNNIQNRIMYSFEKYRMSVAFEYKHRPDDPGLWSYALIKCISFLLDNKISVNAGSDEVRYWNVANFIRENTKFENFRPEKAEATYQLAYRLISELENTEASGAINVLHIKYLLRTHSTDRNKILRYSVLNHYPFSIFVTSVLTGKYDDLITVEDQLKKAAADKRKYDAYDPVYVLDDIRFVWESLKDFTTHDTQFVAKVDEILQLDLVSL